MALLVLILPMAVMAKAGGWIPTLPGQASDNAFLALSKSKDIPVTADLDEDKDDDEAKDDVDEDTVEPDEDMMSEQALFIAARNDWAKSEEIGIAPGHANLLYKLWIKNGGDATVKTFPQAELEALLLTYKDSETGKIDVKKIMSDVNGKEEPANDEQAAPKGNAIAQAARNKVKNNSKK